MRPYRLRGSFVSLLLWAGEDLTYVAEPAGHSVATLALYYAGVIKELHGQPKMPAAEAIRVARERISCTADVRHANRARLRETAYCLQIGRWAMLGSNQRPPPCRDGALPAELIAREELNVPGSPGCA